MKPRVIRVAIVLAAAGASCVTSFDQLDTETVALSLAPGSASYTSQGALETVTVTAADNGSGIGGLTITLAGSGLSFSPSSLTTDGSGSASTTVLVPYGTGVLVTASSAGSGYAMSTLVAPPAQLIPAPVQVSAVGLQGTTLGAWLNVRVAVRAPSGSSAACTANGSGGNPCVIGLPVSFASTGSATTFSPASTASDGNGSASTTVFVPYGGAPFVATVSGGGGSATLSLSSVLPELDVDVPDLPQTSYQAGGALATLGVGVSTGSAGVPGVSVGFATNTSGATFVRASVVTDGSGSAVSQVLVPYGTTNVIATVTVAGMTKTIPLVTLPATITASVGPGIPTTIGSNSTGLVFPVTATVRDTEGDTVAGVPVTFTQIGAGNNAFTPNPSVTGSAGTATSYVFVQTPASGPIQLVGLASVGSLVGSGSDGLAAIFTAP